MGFCGWCLGGGLKIGWSLEVVIGDGGVWDLCGVDIGVKSGVGWGEKEGHRRELSDIHTNIQIEIYFQEGQGPPWDLSLAIMKVWGRSISFPRPSQRSRDIPQTFAMAETSSGGRSTFGEVMWEGESGLE